MLLKGGGGGGGGGGCNPFPGPAKLSLYLQQFTGA